MPAKGYSRNFKPFRIITEEQIESIHHGSLDILEEVGVRFESQKALNLFERNGCKVDQHARRVRFPPGLVEECLELCPSSFSLRALKKENNLNVGGNTMYWAAFPGMRTVNIDTWEPCTPTVQENHDAVKVLDSLENVHLACSYTPYCELEGVPPAMLLPTSCWSQMKYFAKPVRVGQAQDSHIWGIQMAQLLDVDIFAAMESAPPLTWYEDAIDCAWDVAEAGYPVEVGCGAVLGGTGPATLAGGLSASNAEVMSGIVLVQLVRPRTPILSNAFVFPQNMMTGAPGFGRIEISLFNVMYNQMWRGKYNIPTMFGSTGMGNSKAIDYQLGYEKSIATVLTAISGASIINFVGGLTGELSHHPVLSVLDNDVAGMIGRFLEGVEINHETLATDLIEKVGPIPGFFLGEAHTREWWKREQYLPKVSDQLTHAEWSAAGRKSAMDYAKEKVEQILDSYEQVLPDDKDQELDRILEDARRYYQKQGLI
jgi:trimethylamine---corrinoid protein Co-methyltransferase